MKVLIEGYCYAPQDVKDILQGLELMEDLNGKQSINFVGYAYNPNPKIHDCVFVLPKVLINADGLAFNKYNPRDLVNFDDNTEITEKEKNFVYGFSVWMYRTMRVFRDSNINSSIILQRLITTAGRGERRQSSTFLDVLLALADFNRENQDFFMMVVKNQHSGINKINWTRTIAHTDAIIQKNSAIYLNPINKKRKINFDEELIIIFYSILNYIHEQYGFPIINKFDYDLIKGGKFEHYMNGYGKTRLLQIKYKYFSDRALKLWNLCYAFFERSHQIPINSNQMEYLMAKDFNIVFEAIIDELIGDKRSELPDGLKDQEDGKRVDHLFKWKQLIVNGENNNDIFYIGDSKYYKLGNAIGDESVYKQYTYARNVIQWNINLFVDEAKRNNPEYDAYRSENPICRDEVTEGYNIIPNFFISAKMAEDLSYTDTIFGHEGKRGTYISKQFENRLFDRDTLLISHYDVNFLFIVSLYARNNAREKAEWKDKVREMFRKEIQDKLKERYNFFAMKSTGNPTDGDRFITEHFKELQGKIFCPYDDHNIYSLALEQNDNATLEEVRRLLGEQFIIIPAILGGDPHNQLEQKVREYRNDHPNAFIPDNLLPEYHLERYENDYFVVGMYHDQQHWEWITGKNDKGSLIYNVRLDPERQGAQIRNRLRTLKPKFAILYEEGHQQDNNYHVFRIHDFAVMKEDRMRKALYPNNHGGPRGDYFIFRFDEEVSIGRLNLNVFIENYHNNDFVEGSPLYPKGSDLIMYRV